MKKLAGAVQQLRSNKAAAFLRSGVALSPDRVQSLHAALLHKAAKAEHATSSRDTAAAVVGDAIGSGEVWYLEGESMAPALCVCLVQCVFVRTDWNPLPVCVTRLFVTMSCLAVPWTVLDTLMFCA